MKNVTKTDVEDFIAGIANEYGNEFPADLQEKMDTVVAECFEGQETCCFHALISSIAGKVLEHDDRDLMVAVITETKKWADIQLETKRHISENVDFEVDDGEFDNLFDDFDPNSVRYFNQG